MVQRLVLLAWILAMFGGSFANAAEPMGWSELADAVIRLNPELEASRARVLSTDYESKAAYSGYFPQFSLFASRLDQKQETNLINTRTKTDTYGLKSNLSLFSGFSTVAAVDRARSSREIARASLRVRSADLRTDLRKAYFLGIIAKKRQQLAEKVLERRRKNVSLMGLKYSSGAEAKWSLQQAEADLEVARLRLANERRDADRSTLELKRLLALSENETLAFKDESDAVLLPISIEAEIRERKVLPDTQVILRQLEQSRADSRLVRAEYFPQVSLGYQYGRADADNSEPIDDHQILLKIELPIFSGFSTKFGLQRAAALSYALEKERVASDSFWRARLLDAHRSYETSLMALPIATSQLKAAESRVSTVTEQYRLGLRRYLEWEDAQSKLIVAEQNVLQVRADALNFLADLERARGLGLED